jgi:arylformamidase
VARVPYVETASLPENQRSLAPIDSHIFRALVHSPEALRRYKGLTKFIREESGIDARLREMALIQVGYVANCAYEYTHHIKTGLRYGVSPEDIRAIADESAGTATTLDPLAKAVLRAARQLTLGHDVDEATFETLQSALGDEQLLELLFSVVTYTGTVKLLTTLRVDLEDTYKHYLDEFPIRGATRGPLVYLTYDQAALDDAYDQAVYAPNRDQLHQRYRALSDAARAQLGVPERFFYGTGAIEHLDVFRTAQPNAPVFAFIHGGAWKASTSDRYAFLADTFVQAGAHLALIDFSGVDELDGNLLAMVRQVRSAIAWLYANAAGFGGDRNRIFAGGHSSGAHITGCVGVTDWAEFDTPPDVVKGLLCCSGMYDLVPVSLSKRSEYVRFDAETIASLSSGRQIDRITAPVIVAYGTEESPEFQRQNREFAAALEAAGKRVELIVATGYNHFEIIETLANPLGLLGFAALAQMDLSGVSYATR